MAKTDILRAICRKGGMILYENLEDMGLSPLEEVKQTVSQNPDMFGEVCLGGKVFVTARSSISLCEAPDCLGCKRLHMCQSYMLGSCDDTGCPFSHDLYSPNNLWVLKQYGLNGLKVHEICVLLFRCERPPEPPPKALLQLDPTAPPQPLPAIAPHSPPSQGPPQPPLCLTTRPCPGKAISHLDQDFSESDDICQMNLIHRCSAEGQCDKIHCNMPYMWQRRHGKHWWALPNNEEIERDYCNPVKTKHTGFPPVDFEMMRSGSDEVRRLSITSPEFHTASLFNTKWAWYWELSDDQWTEYAAPVGQEDKVIITSERLEQKYQRGAVSVLFACGRNQYIINFADMIQTNQTTEMKRLVRRRPVLISWEDVQNVCEKYEKTIHSSFLSSVPQQWNHSLLPGTGYERVKIGTSSPDYRSIVRQFNKTMRESDILSIERIQNLKLWRQKNQMKNDAGKDVQMQRLFHGTESEYIDAVCHGNTDWSFSTIKDTRFGRGSYFAKDASYANEHTDKQEVRCMFMCQVIVGDYALGKPDYYRPPFKDAKKTVSFDSCVDDLAHPSVYIIFERNQTYPEFLIKYKVEAEAITRVKPQRPPAQPQPHYEPINEPNNKPINDPINVFPWLIVPPPPRPKKKCCIL